MRLRELRLSENCKIDWWCQTLKYSKKIEIIPLNSFQNRFSILCFQFFRFEIKTSEVEESRESLVIFEQCGIINYFHFPSFPPFHLVVSSLIIRFVVVYLQDDYLSRFNAESLNDELNTNFQRRLWSSEISGFSYIFSQFSFVEKSITHSNCLFFFLGKSKYIRYT